MAIKTKHLKSSRMELRLTDEEVNFLKKKVKEAGLDTEKDKSKFVRTLIRNNETLKFFHPREIEMMQFHYANVARVGGLLNQLMRILNLEHIRYLNAEIDDVEVDVKKLETVIKALREDVLSMKRYLIELAQYQVK